MRLIFIYAPLKLMSLSRNIVSRAAGLVFLISSGLVAAAPMLAAQDDPQAAGRRVLATTSLAAKEYADGVAGGEIVLREEVEEARLFLEEARGAAAGLPAAVRDVAGDLIAQMQAAVASVESPGRVGILADSLSDYLTGAMPGLSETLPFVRPDAALGARVYAQACASCHGDAGMGDGPVAAGLEPPPSDLTDAAALADQSPLDFYRKVLIGVSGTAMPPFEGALSDEEIWAAAWRATELRYQDRQRERGAEVLATTCPQCDLTHEGLPALAQLPELAADPAAVATRSDETLRTDLLAAGIVPATTDSADLDAVVAYLRTVPFAPTPSDRVDPAFGEVRTVVARGLRAALAGDAEAAARALFDSYVAFEAVETAISLRDAGLVSELEFAFSDLRSRASRGEDPAQLAASYERLDSLLTEGAAVISEDASSTGLLAQSFILLVREGMEALLIVGALAALVVRAGREDRKRDIGWGVGTALGASVLTAVLFETVFRIGVAQQEMLEGITMLVAAAVLLMVSYWLVSKIEVRHWNAFVASQSRRALRDGSRFALAATAFLAVYREGFETVLFYKALVLSTDGQGVGAIVMGALLASAVLVALYVAINRFGVRIPIRPFFAVTSAFLIYMAFSFVGKGIAELQESALVSTTLLDWAPRVPWMGIYPTAETLVWQLAIVGLVAAGLVWTFVLEPGRRTASSPTTVGSGQA